MRINNRPHTAVQVLPLTSTVKYYTGAVVVPVAHTSVMEVGAMAELEAVEADQLTMFQVLDQDKATVAEAVKHLIKAELHLTATVMHVLAAMEEPTRVVVVATVDQLH